MLSHTRRTALRFVGGAVALSGISSVVGAEETKTEEFVIRPADSHQGSSEDTCATTGEWTKTTYGARLPDGTTTYRLEGEDTIPSEDGEDVQDVVADSFETWADVAEVIDFSRDSDSDNVVRFVPMGFPGVLGRAWRLWRVAPGPQRILRFDIRINTDHELGFLEPNPVCDSVEGSRVVNIQDVVTHEVGHVIGLGHTQSEESNGNTMSPFGYFGSTFASTLAEGDKNGAHALYHE